MQLLELKTSVFVSKTQVCCVMNKKTVAILLACFVICFAIFKFKYEITTVFLMDKIYRHETSTKAQKEKLLASAEVKRKSDKHETQRELIKEYCDNLDPLVKDVMNATLDNILLSEKNRIAMCRIPKIASTTWTHFFLRHGM